MGKLLQLRGAIGAILVLLGGAAIIGWLTRTDSLVQLIPGSVAMVFNTALCFVVAGAVLLLQLSAAPLRLAAQRVGGALVAAIAVLAASQNLFGIDLGIDQLVVEVRVADTNPHPGRMAPMSALGFALAGLFFMLQERLHGVSSLRLLLQLSALAVLTLGIVGLTGYSLKLELLYTWYHFARMAPHTAFGFILLGLALWLTWYQALRASSTYEQRDEQRITALAAVILLVMALTAGMVGFVLSSQRAEAALNHNMTAAHANRAQLLNFVIDNTLRQARSLATDPALLELFGAAAAQAEGDGDLARHLLSDGYASVVALDMAGKPMLAAGVPLASARIALSMNEGVKLLWDNAPIIEVRVPVQRGADTLGSLVVQRHLPVVKTMLSDAQLLGRTGDIAICGALGAHAMHCLPTRLNPAGFSRARRLRDGKPLPMHYALQGQSGLAIARDYRGAQVVAAYGPVGETGLGLVVKEDAADLYQPIRSQLQTMLAVLMVLFASGMLLLRWQLTPMVTALLHAKRQARAGEEKIQAVVDNMADGLLTLDQAGAITSINPAAAAMFGYAPDEVVGKGVEMLIPQRLRQPHLEGMRRYLGGGEPRIVGRPGVQVPGLKRSGAEFPMQIAIREAQVEGGRMFVGILRDITAQKKALETSSRFNAFLEATPNLVAFVGTGQQLLYINGAGRALLGLGRDQDCSAVKMSEFVCPDAPPASLCALFPADTERAWRGEYALCARDGTVVPLMFTVVRIAGQDGESHSFAMVGVDVSERKRAEHDLRKTLERYDLLSRATNDTVWDWDFTTDDIGWNAGIEETFGYAPAQVEAQAGWWVDHIHPDDAQGIVESVDAAVAAGSQTWTGEYRFLRAGGGYAYVHDRGYIIRDAQGKAVRMIGAMMDISERKEVEERLRQLEQRFSKIFSMSPVAISVSRLADGEVLEVNDAFARMFGYERHQLAMHTALLRKAFQSPEDRVAMAERITDESAIRDFETSLHTRDGSVINVLFSAEVVELDGEPHLLCLYNDITERKRTEHALRYSEEKFRSIVETTKDWVWTTDNEDRLVYSNPAVGEMLGYQPQELLGSVMMEYLHPDEREAVRAEVRRLRARGEGWSDWHTRWRHKDGSDRYLKSSAQPVLDANGMMVGYRGTDHDLTAIKEFEIELREAKQKAEHASQAKSEFLDNMSHEIRTPMNGVIGLTRLVLRTSLSEQQREYMELIQASADSLLRLLNDILDFSKMEAKKLALEMVQFELREEVGNVLRSFGAAAADKELELALDVASDVPAEVVGDNGRLAQVLINLTSNAIKFTRQGEVVLRVRRVAEAAPSPGHALLHFSVADTGIGISPRQQAHVFDSFVQADASTTRQYGGTGLGLAIVAQIVALMEGRLWVESEAGQGATFHFTVRLRVPQQQAATAAARGAPELKGRRILVADENPTTRAILGAILRSWDMYPALAESATHALAEARRAAGAGEAYSLALCDARMAGQSALELARTLAGGSAPAAVVALTSARDAAADIDALRAAGVAECVRKPVKHSELLVALMKALQPGAAAPAALAMGGAQQQPAAAPAMGPGSVQGGPGPVRPLRVLVAEDHPINQTLVTELLRTRGHFYAVAGNGIEVLRLLEQGKFDAILMDGQMPEMDGYQATAEIRRREQAAGSGHIHIVAVTAHAMHDDREACLAAGMDDYMAKPIEPDELFTCLERPWSGAAGGARAGAQAAAANDAGAPVFDVETALRRTRGKKTLLLQMARAFLADAPDSLQALRAAAASGEPERIERSAHRMKGAAATLTGEAVVQAAAAVERLARAAPEASSGPMAAAIAELETRTAELADALSHLLNQEKP